MTASEAPVLVERRGGVAVLTFNRPERLNAWTAAMESRYFDLLDEAEADPDVRAIVVTGAGRAFCAGADFDDVRNGPSASDPRPHTYPLSLRTPLVAAVNGGAAGLGLAEALFADVRFCVSDAKLTSAFSRRGLIAEHGTAWLLPRLVGTSRAMDLLLSGRVVRGEEAHRIGLVDHLAPRETLVEDAVAYATDLSENCSPTAMAVIKEQVHRALTEPLAESIAHADKLMAESQQHPDMHEGITSFLEKRAPRFLPLEPLR